MKILWICPVACVFLFSTVRGALLVVEDYAVDDPADAWTLNTNDVDRPIIWDPENGRVRLIELGDTGRAVSMIRMEETQVRLQEFTVQFSFEMEPADPSRTYGDGMVFFLGDGPSDTYLGGAGGNMGWGGPGNVFPSIAVEFDTWVNGDEEFEGWSENHIGVSYLPGGNGDQSPRSAYMANPMDFGFRDMEGGGKFTARLVWACGNFELYLSNEDQPELGEVRILEGTFPFSYGFYARAGFTAGTGTATNEISLYSFLIEAEEAPRCGDRDPELPFRINAGGSTYVDPYGLQWNTDMLLGGGGPMGARTGGAYSGIGRMPCRGTNSDRIFQSERWGASTWYFSLPDGVYGVVLHWMEFFSPGVERVMDVSINGQLVLDDFCPVRAAGGMYAACSRAFRVQATEGAGVTIEFTATDGSPQPNPKISAIEVLPGGVPGSPLSVTAVAWDLRGDRRIVSNGLGAIDSSGFIKTWLLLGPFDTTPNLCPADGSDDAGCSAPSLDDMRMDYLAGEVVGGDLQIPVTEVEVADGSVPVYGGLEIAPDYGGAAYSSGLYRQTRTDMNPDPEGIIASWFLWVDDDAGVDYNHVHQPDVDRAMSYAVTYVAYDGRFGPSLPVTIGVSSDDSILVLLNGEEVIASSQIRGWGGGSGVQDRGDAVLGLGMNVIMTKVFEGGGGFGFRLRLEERGTARPLTAGDGISIHTSFFSPIVTMTASDDRIAVGDAVEFGVQVLGGVPPDDVEWDFNAADGLYVEAAGANVSHTFTRAEMPEDRTFVVTACVQLGDELTTVQKRIVVAPDAIVDEFPPGDESWDDGLWLDEPFHLGRGLQGAGFEVGGGRLVVGLPRGGDYNSWTNFDYAPKLLVPVPPLSDWAIETRVTELSRDPGDLLHAGLIASLDEGGLLAWPSFLMHGIINNQIQATQSGTRIDPAFGPPEWAGGPPMTTSLLMMKKGDRYEFYYRLDDGRSWRLLASRSYGKSARQVGIFAKNWEFTAGLFEFDYLRFNGAVPEGPRNLAASREGTEIGLTWENPVAYDSIEILRDGEAIAQGLPGSTTAFSDDLDPLVAESPDGFVVVTYEVRGFVGAAFGYGSVLGGATDAETVVFQEGLFPDPSYRGAQDAHIIRFQSWDGEWNTGAHDHIEEGDWNGGHGDHKEILVEFDLSPIPTWATIDFAELRLYYDYSRDGSTVEHQAYAHAVLKEWNEGTGTGVDGRPAMAGEVTWQSPRRGEATWDLTSGIWTGCDIPVEQRGGAYGLEDIDTSQGILSNEFFGNMNGTWVTWDVTPFVQEWVAEPSGNHGMKITQNPGHDPCFDYVDGGFDFISSNHGSVALRPMLVVRGQFGPPPVPEIDVAPVSLDYGEVFVGSSRALSTVIRNIGTADLVVSRIALGGGTSPDFAITSGPTSTTLAPGAQTTVQVTYSPGGVGADSGTLLVESNDADEPTVTVSLGGNGVPEPVPEIDVAPVSLDYGEVFVGSSRALSTVIRNIGTADLVVSRIALGGGTSPDFAITAGPTSTTLAPGAQTTVQVTYTPGEVGTDSGTLLVESNDADEPTVTVSLGGQGAAEIVQFRRADANDDGRVDLADPIKIANIIFVQGSVPSACLLACDVDGDDRIGITDPIYLLNYLFRSGPPPVDPWPACGPVPEDPPFPCTEFMGCPR